MHQDQNSTPRESNTQPNQAQAKPRARRTCDQILEAERAKLAKLEEELAKKREKLKALEQLAEQKKHAVDRKTRARGLIQLGLLYQADLSRAERLPQCQRLLAQLRQTLSEIENDPEPDTKAIGDLRAVLPQLEIAETAAKAAKAQAKSIKKADTA